MIFLKQTLLLIASFFFIFDVQAQIIPGALQLDEYIPLLTRGKVKVGVVCNHSSLVGKTHLVDTLVSIGIDVKRIFVPEHGFRGDADAGQKVENQKDEKTGIEIHSLYGDKFKPTATSFLDLDYIIFDIQDVGVRFYTYISTLQYVMEVAAQTNKFLIILDRPNPNGHYIDGPILESSFTSFVGMQQIPIVYGMTIGEYANFLKNEKLLENKVQPKMKIIKCLNYDHKMKVSLDVSPSPNLKSDLAIALYPTLCLFEGTNVSVGRGTDRPFEMIGSPFMDAQKYSFQFTPVSKIGASNPMYKNRLCYGKDFADYTPKNGIDLDLLLETYKNWTSTNPPFFALKNNFFDKLVGTDKLRKMITSGRQIEDIKKSWAYDLATFNKIRKRYLLYEDFEDLYNR
jgi:uncharacterized protein YbbC (DUF1343 family)